MSILSPVAFFEFEAILKIQKSYKCTININGAPGCVWSNNFKCKLNGCLSLFYYVGEDFNGYFSSIYESQIPSLFFKQ